MLIGIVVLPIIYFIMDTNFIHTGVKGVSIVDLKQFGTILLILIGLLILLIQFEKRNKKE